jgi:hypothetical protein
MWYPPSLALSMASWIIIGFSAFFSLHLLSEERWSHFDPRPRCVRDVEGVPCQHPRGPLLYRKRRSFHPEAARGAAVFVQCTFCSASAVPGEEFVLEMHTDEAGHRMT